MTNKQRGAVACLTILALLTVSYQNCTQVSSPVAFSEATKPKAEETEGNGGQPYDGKIFVTLGDVSPDQSTIHRRIVVKSPQEGQMVRDNCQEITPVALTEKDFQLDANDSNKLLFRGEALGSEGLVDLSTFHSVKGLGIWINQDFETAPDSRENYNVSRLRLFENGIELGPAHSWHEDIEALGGGRFSHWLDINGVIQTFFSTSDNTDPRVNGRKYTYVIAP